MRGEGPHQVTATLTEGERERGEEREGGYEGEGGREGWRKGKRICFLWQALQALSAAACHLIGQGRPQEWDSDTTTLALVARILVSNTGGGVPVW